MSEQFRSGVYAFDLVQRRARRPAGVPADPPRPVTEVAVVGAGLMAAQLALLFVRRLEVPVVLTDVDADRLDRGVRQVHDQLQALHDKGRLSADRLSRYRALVSGTPMSGFADADLVVEAVYEDLAVKRQVLADVEAVVSPECVLASNTSSLSITAMADGLRHPERVVGLHFFNPVAVMPLVEVVRGAATGDQAVATAFSVGAALRKTCIGVRDSPSFVVNRLLGRFLGEVLRSVDEGAAVPVVDSAFAGLTPMPPFQLLQLVGPAIALHNSRTLAAAFPDRFEVSPLLERLAREGADALGPATAPASDQAALDRVAVRERVLDALAQEVRLLLDEGVVGQPQDVDLAMLTGAGFAFWNGGLTPLLDRSGAAERATGRRFLPRDVASLA